MDKSNDTLSKLQGKDDYMTENKDVVMRLTNSEKELIRFIRDTGHDRFSSQLMLGSDDLAIRTVFDLLKTKSEATISSLIADNFITKEEVAYLINELNNGNSIIITGGTGVGKTTLLNALAFEMKNRNIRILQRYEEFKALPDFLKNNSVIIKTDSDILSSEILEQAKEQLTIINEISLTSCKLAVCNLLMLNSQILTTMHSSCSWKGDPGYALEKLVSFMPSNTKYEAKSIIKSKEINYVDIKIENGHRKVSAIIKKGVTVNLKEY